MDYDPDRARALNGSFARVETFAFGAVSMEGRAIYRTATFVAPGAHLGKDAARLQLEKYLEGFEGYARTKLKNDLGPSEMVIFAVFDPTESCLPWHVPLMQDLSATRALIEPKRLSYLSDQLSRAPVVASNTYSILEWISSGAGKKAQDAAIALASTKLDPSPYLDALRAAVTEDAQSWGEFNLSMTGRVDMEEAYRVLARLKIS